MRRLIEIDEIVWERYDLAKERAFSILEELSDPGQKILQKEAAAYFRSAAAFLVLLSTTFEKIRTEGFFEQAKLEELAEMNHSLFEDILPDRYETSFANPAYAASVLGKEYGALLSAVYAELRSSIAFLFEGDLEEVVIRQELILELYASFVDSQEEMGKFPKQSSIRESLYWFASDYSEMATEKRIHDLLCGNPLVEKVLAAYREHPEDVRYLYRYGCYISKNELELARFMAALPEDEVNTMADTYTEGYRIGFEITGKDLSIKKTAEMRYPLGMERMIVRAIDNFEKLGLSPAIHRPGESLLYAPAIYKAGFVGGNPNRQYDYDHKDDRGLLLDKNYVNRLLEASLAAFETHKEEARGYAGPAVVESFGEADFDPISKPEAISLTKEQNKLWVEYRTKAGNQQRNYIIEEERSFTIIAFPTPEIRMDLPDSSMESYAAFFREIIRVNTLDYTKYQKVQQTMIDALNEADYCEIKGSGSNRTNLRVNLWKLKNPAKEAIFENCVADVNIPVGEVFTSPVLEGTEGTLHVSRVFLNGLEFKDLELTFKEGKITSYRCSNFGKEEDNLNFIKENILFRHETLPMGEFAIGTNTTAYAVARKYHVEKKLPILIAEKTGPHFAVGDTCYSHAEEIAVFNPDGKEIVARENSCSLLRKENPGEGYFNCHTDITIPYDELGELTAVTAKGERIPVILGGRFVLPGTEFLNDPLGK